MQTEPSLIRRCAAFFAGALILGAAACGDDDSGVDVDVDRDQVEENIDEGVDDVEERIDEGTDEIEERIDDDSEE